jgi:cytochrome c-type biogenesis protein CcmF
MIAETGHYALILALALAIVQTVLPLWGTRTRDPQLTAVAAPAAQMQFVLIAIAFSALMTAYVTSDFSLQNVWANSHSAKPLIYKIAGVWGNHEGSMVLWVLILALFGAAVATFGTNLPRELQANVLAVQGSIAAAFLLFIITTSNPFIRLDPAPLDGQGLNPVLQDPALAFHPPFLYTGYVGFSMAFSFAVAALIDGRIDAAWARWVRPWTLAAWMCLTLGIAMGSWWAYYELGWGGFWFWDPVENASLMPWLAATALLHCTAVMEKREALKIWTIFLAILAFSLSLVGTFLVRSGVLTSVHAFASDPTRGVFILLILVIFIGGSFALFALRAGGLQQGGLFAPVSREGAIVLNNLLLTTCCATVFTGTLYPLALEAVTGEKISVGAPFFNLTFIPLFLPLFILMPVGQLLAWKRGDLLGVTQRLAVAFAAGLVFGAILAASRGGPAVSVILSGVAVYVILGSFVDLGRRLFGGSVSADMVRQRARGLPRHAFGTAFAHAGLGVTLLGLAATGWGAEKIIALKPGEVVEIGPYELTFESVVPRNGPNYSERAGHTLIRSKGALVATIEPATRFYPARRMNRSEAGIATLGLGQVYMSIADVAANGAVNARIFWKPLVALIWIGALVMAFGGCLSLSDLSFRVGIARRARKAQAPRPQPAE